jgi:hypothetical protein
MGRKILVAHVVKYVIQVVANRYNPLKHVIILVLL